MISLRASIVHEIPHLRRYAIHLAHDLDDADDLVQACIERALAREAQWNPSTRLRPWLFRIEHNLYVSARRRASPENHAGPMWTDMAGISPDPEMALELRTALEGLDRIPAEQAQTIRLVALYDLSYKAAADALDIPVGTVRSRMSRGRASLRAALGLPRSAPGTDTGTDTGGGDRQGHRSR